MRTDVAHDQPGHRIRRTLQYNKQIATNIQQQAHVMFRRNVAVNAQKCNNITNSIASQSQQRNTRNVHKIRKCTMSIMRTRARSSSGVAQECAECQYAQQEHADDGVAVNRHAKQGAVRVTQQRVVKSRNIEMGIRRRAHHEDYKTRRTQCRRSNTSSTETMMIDAGNMSNMSEWQHDTRNRKRAVGNNE